METFLYVIQFIIALALIGSVLMQRQSGGLGSAFAGGTAYHTKRGIEKGIFYFTIILAVLFTLNSIALLLI
jgi:preprotein translocase subunit SecG